VLTPTRTILIRGSASVAKHTANQNTTTVATTSAGRNALKEAQPKLTRGHNLHQRPLRQPNYHHHGCRWRPLQNNLLLSKAPQVELFPSPANTTRQATQHTSRQTGPARSTASASITSPTSLQEPLPPLMSTSPADADQKHRMCRRSLRQPNYRCHCRR
jgi:hypothetical protein